MDDVSPDLLEAIQRSYEEEVSSDRKIGEILRKIEQGKAGYADAYDYAGELGECLARAFSNNISEDVLPDGKMYYNIARKLVEPMIEQNYEAVAAQCVTIQNSLNSRAGLGLTAVSPSYSQKSTDYIVQYISDADSYGQREKSFLDMLASNARTVVDGSVHDNADFHYNTGLSPRIVRAASWNACEWCQKLAGTYDYEDVMDTGNDVFRRHDNCRCTVIYDPSDGARRIQDVWSKEWMDEPLIEERKKYSVLTSSRQRSGFSDVMDEYIRKATPGKGNIYVGSDYKTSRHRAEISTANRILNTFGGEIYLLSERYDRPVTDYLWNGEKWDLKTPISVNPDTIVRHGLKQISGPNCGGLFIDVGNNYDEIRNVVLNRVERSATQDVDIVFFNDDALLDIVRYSRNSTGEEKK